METYFKGHTKKDNRRIIGIIHDNPKKMLDKMGYSEGSYSIVETNERVEVKSLEAMREVVFIEREIEANEYWAMRKLMSLSDELFQNQYLPGYPHKSSCRSYYRGLAEDLEEAFESAKAVMP